MNKVLIRNADIITMDHKEILKNQVIYIEDNLIKFIGEYNPNLIDESYKIFDAKGKIAMPGLINTHGHAAMSLLRGYADDLPLKKWLEEKMWPKEATFTKKHIRIGTELAIIEMIKSGTTTFSDMYSHMEEVAYAAIEIGIRASLSRGVIGLCSREEQIDKLNDAINFATNWHNQYGLITTMLAPHSPYTCPPDYIIEIVNAAVEFGLPIQIHVSESLEEVDFIKKTYHKKPIQFLADLGLFKVPTLLAHVVHIDEDEIDILTNHTVSIAHNPASNLKLGNGIAPVTQFLAKGINVSLGTDSAASNNKLDLFEEMRLASYLQKGYQQNPLVIPAWQALEMATINGAKALRLDKVGKLKEGYLADIIFINKKQPHLTPIFDLISHMVYSANGKDVSDVMINGKWIMQDRKILTIDEDRVLNEVQNITNTWE